MSPRPADDADAPSSPDARPPPEAPPDAWDRAAAWLARHGAVPALGVLTLVLSVIYGGVFRGEIFGDDLTFHFAESARLADCLRHGDLDLWNPSANGGFASAYYYQVLPQLASALPAALLGHHLFWFQLTVFLPLVLAPAGAYRGMRLLGATPWQAAIAGFAIAFTIGRSRWGFGADGTFSVGLYTQTWALAAFPVALGHGVRWALDARGLAAAIAWSAFVGLCHPFAVIALGLALVFGYVGHAATHGVQHELAAVARRWRARPARGPVRERLCARWQPPAPQPLRAQFLRLALLALALTLSLLPVLVPLIVDYAAFGGFPHRVADEVGPGVRELGRWFATGAILDHDRHRVLTFALPVVLLFARGAMLRWLWIPGLGFALLLGLGPHLGKTGNDLLPAVRFLGAMQIVLALAIGAGAYAIGRALWQAPRWRAWNVEPGVRTAMAAAIAALAVLIAVRGGQVQRGRVRVLADYPAHHRDEMMQIIGALALLPDGRKQVGPGCENHWWNLLSYAYARVPALLQMGGGGLQASPNYDFLWTVRDHAKNAHLFDAPYLVFDKAKGASLPAGEAAFETLHYVVRRLPTDGLVSPIQITGVLPRGPTGAKSKARESALAWHKSDLPLRNLHLVYHGFGGETAPPAGKTLRAWRQDSPGDHADIVAELEVTAPTTFVVRESWHPRWHAYLDGAEVPIRRVTPDFPAVDVPAGAHVLQLRFERPWWAHAAWLAWPGTALLAWLASRRRGPRSVTA